MLQNQSLVAAASGHVLELAKSNLSWMGRLPLAFAIRENGETETKTADGAGLNVVVNGRLQERVVDQVAALFSRTPIPQVEQRHDKKSKLNCCGCWRS
jgi:hypothetical protein